MLCIFVAGRSIRSILVAKKDKPVPKKPKVPPKKPPTEVKPKVVKKTKPKVKQSVRLSISTDTVTRMYGD